MNLRPGTTLRAFVAIAGIAALALSACGNATPGTAAIDADAVTTTSDDPALDTETVAEPTPPDAATSDDNADGGAIDSDSNSESEEDTDTNPTDPEPEPADPDEDDTPDADMPTDPACLIGQWRFSQDSMQAFYDTMDTPATFTVTGNTGLEFTADTFEYTPDFTLDIDIQGMPASGTLVGSIAGSYTTSDGIITTSNENNDVQMTVSVMGSEIDGGGMFDEFMAMSPVNDAPFYCDSPGPVIMFETSGDRIPMQLEPNN